MPNGARELPQWTAPRLRSIKARVRDRRIGWLAAIGIAVAAFLAAAPWRSADAAQPVWTELKWPFPIDQWGIGKTFGCEARNCGREIDLHLRAKIGFCNCATGVASDEELERVADFDLLGNRRFALAPGRAVNVQKTAGRSRAYSISVAAASAVTGEEKL